jgi:hypothetical protein
LFFVSLFVVFVCLFVCCFFCSLVDMVDTVYNMHNRLIAKNSLRMFMLIFIGVFLCVVFPGFDLLDDCRSTTRAVQYALDFVDIDNDCSAVNATSTIRLGRS